MYMIILSVGLFFVGYLECSESSSYLEKLKFNKYIVIKNGILSKILISKHPERGIWIKPYDYNKMTMVGLIAYVITLPFNLLQIILAIIQLFKYNIINNMNQIATVIRIITMVMILITAVIRIINLKECEYELKHKKKNKG